VSRAMRCDSLRGLSPGTSRMSRPLWATSMNSPFNARSTIWKRFLRNSVLVTFMLLYYCSVRSVRVLSTHLVGSGLVYNHAMVIRNISEAKAELSALIARVQQGDEVILAKSGKPVAKIVPYSGGTRPRIPGAMEGEIWIAPDFDELPEDMAEAFGMREPGK